MPVCDRFGAELNVHRADDHIDGFVGQADGSFFQQRPAFFFDEVPQPLLLNLVQQRLIVIDLFPESLGCVGEETFGQFRRALLLQLLDCPFDQLQAVVVDHRELGGQLCHGFFDHIFEALDRNLLHRVQQFIPEAFKVFLPAPAVDPVVQDVDHVVCQRPHVFLEERPGGRNKGS